jgi:hypothetical protein
VEEKGCCLTRQFFVAVVFVGMERGQHEIGSAKYSSVVDYLVYAAGARNNLRPEKLKICALMLSVARGVVPAL